MRSGKLLIYNTSVLTIGTILMKSISVFFNVYLTNRIGSAGIGLFQLITTVYGLFITFASSGIKLGATRLVSESELTDNKQSRAIMRICIKYALSAGLIAAIFLFFFSVSAIITENPTQEAGLCGYPNGNQNFALRQNICLWWRCFIFCGFPVSFSPFGESNVRAAV